MNIHEHQAKQILKKYGADVPDGVFADSVQYGKIWSNAINLAYLMARVDEPGGRFTDRDIALKMEEIGIGANPEKTAQILASAVDLRNKYAAFAYKQLTGNKLDFEGFTLPSQQQSCLVSF